MVDTRHVSRRMALQGLYALGESRQGDLRGSISKLGGMAGQDASHEHSKSTLAVLCSSFEQHHEQAERLLGAVLKQPLEQIASIERSCMVLAVCEQLGAPETPRQIVISEWVKLGREFGSETGYKMVNKVLDNLELQV